MKVLHYVDENNLSWAETWIRLLKELESNGVRNTVLCRSGGTLLSKLRNADIFAEACDAPIAWLPCTVRNFGEIIDIYQPDIIHTRLSSAARIGGYWGKKKNVPVVSTVDKFAKRYYYDKASLLFACSNAVREHMISLGFPSSRIKVLHNPIDAGVYSKDIDAAKAYRKRYGIAAEDDIIVAAARFDPLKGLDVLIDSYGLLKQESPDLFERTHLFILGDGDEKARLRTLIDKNEISSRVALPGYISDVKPYLWMSDIFVFPTKAKDAFGISLLEAMASGLPAVATRCGGPEDIIEDGVNGILVPANDSRSIFESVKKLLTDRQLKSRLALMAGKRAEQFSVEFLAADTVEAYRALSKC